MAGCIQVVWKNNYLHEGLHRIATLYGDKLTRYELELLRMNRFFMMTEGGNAMSMDDVSEMANAWLKSCLKSTNFKDNVERSRYIGSTRKCAYETFGYRSGRSSRLESSKKVNVSQILALLDRCKIFDDHTAERKFDADFIWREVQIPKATGSKRDAERESINLTRGKSQLFNVLCVTEDEQDNCQFLDSEEVVEEDSKNASLMSSRAGSVVCDYYADESSSSSDESDDENDYCAEGVTNAAKKASRITKRKLSNLITKDLLGIDGDDAMHNVKRRYEKEKNIERMNWLQWYKCLIVILN